MIEQVADGTRRPDYRRAPGDAAATGTLLRLATCIEGHVEVLSSLVPVFEYGVHTGTWDYVGEGYETMTVCPPAGDPLLTVTSTIRLGAAGPRCYGRSTLDKGQYSIRVALVDREPAFGHRRSAGPAGVHGHVLAGLAVERDVPRPSLAQLHGT